MIITLTSLLTALLFSNVCILLLGYLFKRTNLVRRVGTKIIFGCVGVLFVRMMFPYEFSFTKSIYLYEIFPNITRFFRSQMITVLGFELKVYHLLLLIWLVGAIFSIFKIILGSYRLKKVLEIAEEVNDPEIAGMVDRINQSYDQNKKFKIVIIQGLSTPSVTGLINPTILVSSEHIANPYLYYALLHEVIHYYNHDLWKKLLFAIFCAVYWWNPCMGILRETVNDTLELNVDYALTKGLSEEEVTDYLECLLSVSRGEMTEVGGSLAFGGKNISVLQQRFNYVIDRRDSSKHKTEKVIAIVVSGLILLLSTLFIIEPSSSNSDYYKLADSFELSVEDTYLVERDGKYDVYINETYTGTINEVEEMYQDCPIYQD